MNPPRINKALDAGPLGAALLELQGLAVFEALGEGRFREIGSVPKWYRELPVLATAPQGVVRLGDLFPFVDNFLMDAEEVWKQHSAEAVDSGIWIERGRDGRDVALEASALWLLGRPLLLIRNPQSMYLEQHQWLQTAREGKLQYHRLSREIQKKEILLHCIIHDLSQPLMAMRGSFSCLDLFDIPGEFKELIQIGLRQSQKQEQMIREILEAFAGELAAQQEFQKSADQAPDLAQCAQEIVHDFSAAFAERGAHIKLPPGLDLSRDWKITGDASRLRRVWTNLVENALRYSPPDSTVTLGIDDEGEFLRAFVDDEGPGLPSGDTPTRLFALFSKGTERGGKAGLGLYFCRITVERWGGTIGCEPRPERGSRFWFRLRRAERSEPTLATANEKVEPMAAPIPATVARPGNSQPPPTEASWRSLNVLLAEDEESNRKLISLMLKQRGHVVIAVENGRMALAALATQRFDALLADDEMPEMDGAAAVRALREREISSSGTRLPVIGLSGSLEKQGRDRFARAGADTILPKPFQPEALYDALEGFFFRAGVRPASPVERPPAAVTSEKILARFRQNERFVRSLVKVFLRDSARRLKEIRTAVARRDVKALARATHGLAGSADMLGAGRFAESARRLHSLAAAGDLASARPGTRELNSEFSALRRQLASLASAAPTRVARRRARTTGRARKRR